MSIERQLTDALLTTLATTGVAVGDGEQPDAGGWQDAPATSTFVPYCVLHPILGGVTSGTLGDTHGDHELLYQVSCYGGTRAQCQWVADLIHPAVLAFRPVLDGHAVRFVDDDLLGGARRDDQIQPPLWQAVPRYRIYTAPA